MPAPKRELVGFRGVCIDCRVIAVEADKLEEAETKRDLCQICGCCREHCPCFTEEEVPL